MGIELRVKYLRAAITAAQTTKCPDCGNEFTPAGPCRRCKGRGTVTCECIDCGNEHTTDCDSCNGKRGEIVPAWCEWCENEVDETPQLVPIGPGAVSAKELEDRLKGFQPTDVIAIDWRVANFKDRGNLLEYKMRSPDGAEFSLFNLQTNN